VWGWICFSWLLLDRGGNWRRGWGWWGMWVEGHKLLSFPSWGWNRGVDVGLGWARGPPPPPNGRKNIALYSARLWAWYSFFSCVLGTVCFFHGKVGGWLLVERQSWIALAQGFRDGYSISNGYGKKKKIKTMTLTFSLLILGF